MDKLNALIRRFDAVDISAERTCGRKNHLDMNSKIGKKLINWIQTKNYEAFKREVETSLSVGVSCTSIEKVIRSLLETPVEI